MSSDVFDRLIAVPSSTPAIIGYTGLSELLGRSPISLQADFSRKPESLPPAHVPAGTKAPLWVLAEVIEWLRQQPPKAAGRRPVEALAARSSGRGAPTKAERLAAAAAGLSVREWRLTGSKP